MTETILKLTLSRMASPIGELQIVTDAHGVLRALDWSDCSERMETLMRRQYKRRSVHVEEGAVPRHVSDALEAYFAGLIHAIDRIEVETGGTVFQKKAWAALRQIPAGETRTYSVQARMIDKPNAVRAIGVANGANPIGLVVPCHRVIGANGTLTGYGGGLDRKRWLLAHEGATLI